MTITKPLKYLASELGKKEETTVLGEYVKITVSALAGCLLTLYFIFLWMASHGFFLVEKSVAEERRSREQSYDWVMNNPINEMEGLEDE